MDIAEQCRLKQSMAHQVRSAGKSKSSPDIGRKFVVIPLYHPEYDLPNFPYQTGVSYAFRGK